jgi:hypothetical protein
MNSLQRRLELHVASLARGELSPMLRLPSKLMLVSLALALPAGSALAYSLSTTPVLRGWSPLVRLYGHGDADQGVREMQRLTNAYAVALHRKSIDAPTQAFVDDTIEALEDFDLASFHDRLPETRGSARELWVRGDLRGERYLVQRATDRKFQVSLRGARTELAAMSVIVRSTPSKGHGGRASYLMGGRLGLGIGGFEWDSATAAIDDFVRLLASDDGTRAPTDARASAVKRTRALHPRLASEDLEVLSLLFGAYPQLSETLSRLGSVDNVRTTWPSKSYQQLSVHLRGDTERFAQHYPALAKHLSKLDQLARLDLRWIDRQGRSLLTAKVDSDKLAVQIECYVKQGKLLPFRGVRVLEDEPLDYLSEAAYGGTKIVIDARLKLLGVVIKLDDLTLDNWYSPHETYAELGASLRRVPGIHVEGAALGFLPTGLVDAFIPGNIESITRSFFEVAAHGNGKKGLVAALTLGALARGGNGVLEAGIDVEALDNFLVKLGVGMVNERLLPGDAAVRDAKQFAADVHDGFVSDLVRFAAQSGS